MLRLPYDAGSEADVWIHESIMEHFESMADAAARTKNQDHQDMRPVAGDERTKLKCFSIHYQDLDGKLQVLYGLHVDFQKRLAHEVWESGHRKTWKMDQEWNNETRSLFEMFWNQREKKVWMK